MPRMISRRRLRRLRRTRTLTRTIPGWVVLPEPACHWIDLRGIGRVDELGGNSAHGGPGKTHAALARVGYPEGPCTWLLLVKLSLTGRETLDVCQYAKSNRDFPQDSTADQIYDEAQWESYRKLGYEAARGILLDSKTHLHAL